MIELPQSRNVVSHHVRTGGFLHVAVSEALANLCANHSYARASDTALRLMRTYWNKRCVRNDTQVPATTEEGHFSLDLRKLIQKGTQNIPVQRDVSESAFTSNVDQPCIFQFFRVVRHRLMTDLMLGRKIATVDLASRFGNLFEDQGSARLGESAGYALKLLRRQMS